MACTIKGFSSTQSSTREKMGGDVFYTSNTMSKKFPKSYNIEAYLHPYCLHNIRKPFKIDPFQFNFSCKNKFPGIEPLIACTNDFRGYLNSQAVAQSATLTKISAIAKTWHILTEFLSLAMACTNKRQRQDNGGFYPSARCQNSSLNCTAWRRSHVHASYKTFLRLVRMRPSRIYFQEWSPWWHVRMPSIVKCQVLISPVTEFRSWLWLVQTRVAVVPEVEWESRWWWCLFDK